MIRLLQAYGFDSTVASGGFEAHKLLCQPHDIKFIITDMRMPMGDGLQFLDLMKKDGIKIPTILVSGFSDMTEKEALARGAMAVMPKPFDVEKLMAFIGEHFK